MGQYLSIGLATKIYVEKDRLGKEDLEKAFINNFKLSLYDVSEDEDCYILNLKEEVLENNLIELLGEMEQKATKSEKEKYIKAKKELKGKNYKELLDIADKQSVYKFQLLKYGNDISYMLENGGAYCQIISIESDGKVYFECYYDIFTFIRNSVIESLNNELKYAVVVTIIG